MLNADIIGNLGNDAEIKDFSGKKYVSFSVAHSEKRKDANGALVEHTTWVSVLWYGDGGGLFQYLKKGCKVYVHGRLSFKSYTDRNGNFHSSINCIANEVVMCAFAKSETAPQAQPSSSYSATMQNSVASQSLNPDDVNDDLPF